MNGTLILQPLDELDPSVIAGDALITDITSKDFDFELDEVRLTKDGLLVTFTLYKLEPDTDIPPNDYD